MVSVYEEGWRYAEAVAPACVEQLVAVLRRRLPGYWSTVSRLAQKYLGEELGGVPHEWREQALFKTACLLGPACMEKGIFLDHMGYYGKHVGLPQNTGFFVRRIVNRKAGPVSVRKVRGIFLSLKGAGMESRRVFVLRELGALRCVDLDRRWSCSMLDPMIKLSPKERKALNRALRESRVHKWESDYADPRHHGECVWRLEIAFSWGKAIVCNGDGAYPYGFNVLVGALVNLDDDHELIHRLRRPPCEQ